VHPHDEVERDRIHRPGMLFAAGLITGEALLGIGIAVPIVVTGRPDVLALPETWRLGEPLSMWLGLVVLTLIGWLMYRVGAKLTKVKLES
jgi:hypothetical protein